MIARALGGCGIHNAMLYVRALEEDFEVRRVLAVEVAVQVGACGGVPPTPCSMCEHSRRTADDEEDDGGR